MEWLIFIDIDGTLMTDNKEFTSRTKEIIQKLVNKGVKIILCGSRPRYQMIEMSLTVGASEYIICSNGSEFFNYKTATMISSLKIPNHICLNLLKEINKVNGRITFVTDNIELVNKEPKNSHQIVINNVEEIKLRNIRQSMITADNINLMNKLYQTIKNNPELNVVDQSINFTQKLIPSNNFIYFSIGNKQANKGFGVKAAIEYFKTDINHTIGIGNEHNDIPMFSNVGLKVAVSNAPKYIKNMADIICPSNNEEGCAIFLESFYESILESKKNIVDLKSLIYQNKRH